LSRVDAVVTGPVVSFVVDATDNSTDTVKRILVLFREVRTEPSSDWRSLELVQTPDTNRWTGGALIASSEVEYFVQAVDSSGNVAVASNKGRLHEASSLPSPPPPPAEVIVDVIGTEGDNGWFVSDVTVRVTTSTTDEGVLFEASVDSGPFEDHRAAAGDPVDIPIAGDGIHTVHFRWFDGSRGSLVVPIDTTPPTIAIGTPPDGAVYTLGQPVAASYHCTDAGSGVAFCADPVPSGSNIDTSTPGIKAFQVHATDAAGQTFSQTHDYTVAPYAFLGFFPPVDNPPVVNVAKAGSKVPVKWSLRDANGAFIRDVGIVAPIVSQNIACDTGAPLDTLEETAAAGTSGLRYDLANEQFVYVWTTQKSWAGTCRRLVVTLAAGTKHFADFRFK
jgi:hypothetical protein